jgi:Leucine-rich repeat (LRR) protein
VNLKQLFLSFNQISILPEALKHLNNLKYLYIHHNNIAIIPNWITNFSNLERLDLSYNKIFAVPDLFGMPSLSEIDLQENEIAHFPWSLLEKPSLRILVLKNNPFILSEGERHFLKNYNDTESTQLNLVF